jgi:ATP-dependent Clp protease ATP-binding subunit ClpA
MFDTFTDRARKTISLAQQESERFRHDAIGTEHLLLALVRLGNGVAVNALAKLGADVVRVGRAVESLIITGDRAKARAPLPFTPQAKRVLELAMDESRALGHPYVGTEHILLGLLSDRNGVAARALISLGLRLDEVRSEILDLLGADEVAQVAMPPPVSEAPEPAEVPATAVSTSSMPPPTPAQEPFSGPDHLTFDLFSTRALRIVALAHQEAERFHSVTIDTDHLLLGLVKVDGGVTVSLLKDLGVDVETVCREMGKLAITGEKTARLGPPTFAPRAKRVLELALVEARTHGIPYICDEHILLGILTEQDCTGARALTNLGLNLDRFRMEILAMLGANEVTRTVDHRDPVRSVSLAASLRLYIQAKREAEALGHEHIAPEHFHLVLLNDHSSLAVQALRATGVEPGTLRQRIIEQLHGRKQRADGTFGPVEDEGGTGAADSAIT